MINLKKFCDEMRNGVETPRKSNGNIYATDGRIMIVCAETLFPKLDNLLEAPQLWIGLYKNLPQTDFEPVNATEIEALLKTVVPEKEAIFEKIKCTECEGKGEVECECECGDEHEKTCVQCQGKGYIDGKQIGAELKDTPVKIKNTPLNYKYLVLLLEVMKEGGEWVMRLESLAPCVFKTEGITIIVMTMREKNK